MIDPENTPFIDILHDQVPKSIPREFAHKQESVNSHANPIWKGSYTVRGRRRG